MRYGVAVLVAAFLLIIGSIVIIGHGNQTSNKPGDTSRVTKVTDYAGSDSAQVSWTMQGGVVGDDQYNEVRVTVSKGKRIAEVLNGYDQHVVKTIEFANSADGFDTFTRALDHLGFGKERTVAQPDERGVCPQGNRYIYRLVDNGKEIMRTWSDNCNTKDGPFGGGKTAKQIADLFHEQITDYNTFVSEVEL